MENNQHTHHDEPNLPQNATGKHPFGLPLDYFASFESKLAKKLELENELAEFPLLASLQKVNTFAFPPAYFELLPSSLEHTTELSTYPQLATIQQCKFPELDEDYKKQFDISLNYKIELADELKPYPALYAADKLNAFAVPQPYFEEVSARIKDQIYLQKEAHISLLNTIVGFIFGKRMALTFGIACMVGLVMYFNRTQLPTMGQGDCKTLACLEKQEILTTTAISNFDDDQLMDLVDLNSLNNQLSLEEQKKDSLLLNTSYPETIDMDEIFDDL